MNKIKLSKAIFAFIIALAYAACTTRSADSVFTPSPVVLESQDVTTLKIGAPAPFFELPDMYGHAVSIDDFKNAQVLVIAFICNHCPTAQAYEDRLISFVKDYQEKGVAVVAINPNSSLALLPEECGYSDLDDSFETMLIRANHKGYNFPYLYDGDNHAVSLQYGPVTTPHVFVFDNKRLLRYTGRFDGIEKPGEANAEDLRIAVDEVLAGKTVTNPVTKTFGCSVKWSWKSDWAQRVEKEWNQKPVSLDWIDVEGIDSLLVNNSGKLRLINVWATWCTPCVMELPDLISLQRIYGARDFEVITISADKTSQKDKVLKMLENKHAPIRNFIFNEDDKYKLIETVDASWGGAIPYSLLIEPGGNIIYRKQGVVDMLELKRVIVEHPLLGRYF